MGDARLVAELVRRGIDRDAAVRSVTAADEGQTARLERAAARILKAKPQLGYASVARALERLGFPAAAIYRHLRVHASQFGPLGPTPEDCDLPAP